MISGPSGTGKGAICDSLKTEVNAVLSVSMTTRPPRAGEIHGESYFFVSKERFRETLGEGGLLEYTEVFGEYYGTPRAPVIEHLEKGRDVILEIEVNGAMQVRESMPGTVLVFILPPSRDELKRRIEGRGTETEDSIAHRLKRAESEIEQIGNYDYYVVNDKLGQAVLDVADIVRAERLLSADILPQSTAPEDMAAIRRAAELRVGAGAAGIIESYREGSLAEHAGVER